MRTVGEQIRQARKNLGITQKELARHILKEDSTPISTQYLNDLEQDKRKAPPSYLLDQISEVLGLPQEYLRYLAGRLPADLPDNKEHSPEEIKAAFEAFRKTFREGSKKASKVE